MERVRYADVQTIGCTAAHAEVLSVSLLVPPGPPTDTGTSKVIRITYEVEVKTDVGTCDAFPVVRIPVIIGTIPFAAVQPRKEPFSMFALTGGAGSSGENNRLSIISYDPGSFICGKLKALKIISRYFADLPSYEQAMLLNPSDNADEEEVLFSPLYPVVELQN